MNVHPTGGPLWRVVWFLKAYTLGLFEAGPNIMVDGVMWPK